MLFFALVMSAAPTAAAAVMKSSESFSIRAALPKGFVDSPVTWTGFVVNGENTAFNGTIQEVIKQIVELQPDFDFGKYLKPIVPKVSESSHIPSERDASPPSQNRETSCGTRNPIAINPINEGIAYLEGMDESVVCDSAPGSADAPTCGRISCSYDGAIWNCNHNPKPVSYPCRIFVDYVRGVLDECKSWHNGFGYQVSGNQLDKDFGIGAAVGKEVC